MAQPKAKATAKEKETKAKAQAFPERVHRNHSRPKGHQRNSLQGLRRHKRPRVLTRQRHLSNLRVEIPRKEGSSLRASSLRASRRSHSRRHNNSLRRHHQARANNSRNSI